MIPNQRKSTKYQKINFEQLIHSDIDILIFCLKLDTKFHIKHETIKNQTDP